MRRFRLCFGYNQHMAKKQKATSWLMLGALGVVFGDIGTNPLYAFKILFKLSNEPLTANAAYGLTSLLLWTLTLVVSVKYIIFVMRASNQGEGGIMALTSLITTSKVRARLLFIGLGLVGVALFYGDSVVTPAISVLSAMEGLHVVAPNLHNLILPLTVAVLVLLFGLQRFGTAIIGKLFGPIMLLWFLAIGTAGGWRVLQHPAVLGSLSPLTGLTFATHHPLAAFTALGAIVLAVTGAEALYADMGHFGHAAITKAWFAVVFPALALCYLGQAALLVQAPSSISNPLFLLFPVNTQALALVLATLATLIASQSVISGAFSLTRQAIQLGALPKMTVKQTSSEFGQIYMPFVNFLLLTLVLVLVLGFRSSEHLAGAYGVAVSATLAIDTLLFAVVLYIRRRVWTPVVTFLLVFLGLDAVLVSANLPKIVHGGWVPLTVAVFVLAIMWTWVAGRRRLTKERQALEPSLQTYITELHHHVVVRTPGHAVYIGHHEGLTPTALRTTVEEMHEIPEKAVIVYVKTSTKPHVPFEERAAFDDLKYADGISQVTLTYGFHDSPNIPGTLAKLRHLSPELDFDPHKAVYFISLSRPLISKRHGMPKWQKALYALLAQGALSTSDYYHLPVGNTVEVQTLLKI